MKSSLLLRIFIGLSTLLVFTPPAPAFADPAKNRLQYIRSFFEKEVAETFKPAYIGQPLPEDIPALMMQGPGFVSRGKKLLRLYELAIINEDLEIQHLIESSAQHALTDYFLARQMPTRDAHALLSTARKLFRHTQTVKAVTPFTIHLFILQYKRASKKKRTRLVMEQIDELQEATHSAVASQNETLPNAHEFNEFATAIQLYGLPQFTPAEQLWYSTKVVLAVGSTGGFLWALYKLISEAQKGIAEFRRVLATGDPKKIGEGIGAALEKPLNKVIDSPVLLEKLTYAVSKGFFQASVEADRQRLEDHLKSLDQEKMTPEERGKAKMEAIRNYYQSITEKVVLVALNYFADKEFAKPETFIRVLVEVLSGLEKKRIEMLRNELGDGEDIDAIIIEELKSNPVKIIQLLSESPEFMEKVAEVLEITAVATAGQLSGKEAVIAATLAQIGDGTAKRKLEAMLQKLYPQGRSSFSNSNNGEKKN